MNIGDAVGGNALLRQLAQRKKLAVGGDDHDVVRQLRIAQRPRRHIKDTARTAGLRRDVDLRLCRARFALGDAAHLARLFAERAAHGTAEHRAAADQARLAVAVHIGIGVAGRGPRLNGSSDTAIGGQEDHHLLARLEGGQALLRRRHDRVGHAAQRRDRRRRAGRRVAVLIVDRDARIADRQDVALGVVGRDVPAFERAARRAHAVFIDRIVRNAAGQRVEAVRRAVRPDNDRRVAHRRACRAGRRQEGQHLIVLRHHAALASNEGRAGQNLAQLVFLPICRAQLAVGEIDGAERGLVADAAEGFDVQLRRVFDLAAQSVHEQLRRLRAGDCAVGVVRKPLRQATGRAEVDVPLRPDPAAVLVRVA